MARNRLKELRYSKAIVEDVSSARSSCTCVSTGTATAIGRTPPFDATSSTPVTSTPGCTSWSVRTAPLATSARPPSSRGRTTLSKRESQELKAQEELDAIRPDLTGDEIMEELKISLARRSRGPTNTCWNCGWSTARWDGQGLDELRSGGRLSSLRPSRQPEIRGGDHQIPKADSDNSKAASGRNPVARVR